MTGTRRTLDPDALADVVSHLGIAPGPLSPWSGIGAAASGEPVDDELRGALTTIVTATAATWIRLDGAGCSLEYGAWFGADESATALCPNRAGVTVEVPPATDLVAALTADILGASAMSAVPLDLQVSPLQALLLGVVLDEARRDALLALAMAMPFVPRGVACEDAPRLLDDLVARGAGVTALVASAYGDLVPPASADAVIDAFSALCASGHVTHEGGRFVAAGAIRELAPRCLARSAQLTLTAGWLTADGTVTRAGMYASQFGVHDVLVAERVDVTMRLATEPAAAITEQVRAFIGGAPVRLAT